MGRSDKLPLPSRCLSSLVPILPQLPLPGNRWRWGSEQVASEDAVVLGLLEGLETENNTGLSLTISTNRLNFMRV